MPNPSRKAQKAGSARWPDPPALLQGGQSGAAHGGRGLGGVDADKAAGVFGHAAGVGAAHGFKKGQGLGFKAVGQARALQAAGGLRRGQVKPEGEVGPGRLPAKRRLGAPFVVCFVACPVVHLAVDEVMAQRDLLQLRQRLP